jgi:hypothetical protein
MQTRPVEELFARVTTPEEMAEAEERVDQMTRETLLYQILEQTGTLPTELAKALGVRLRDVPPVEEGIDTGLASLASCADSFGGKVKLVVELPCIDPVSVTVTPERGTAGKERRVKLKAEAKKQRGK